MKDRDAAQITGCPFRFVYVHFWINGLEEGAEKGHFPRGPHNRALVPDVHDCDKIKSASCFLSAIPGRLTLIINDERKKCRSEEAQSTAAIIGSGEEASRCGFGGKWMPGVGQRRGKAPIHD